MGRNIRKARQKTFPCRPGCRGIKSGIIGALPDKQAYARKGKMTEELKDEIYKSMCRLWAAEDYWGDNKMNQNDLYLKYAEIIKMCKALLWKITLGVC